MARDQGPLTNWTQYLAARFAAAALTVFDIERNLRSAALFGRALYRLDRRHRLRACHALSASFPEWSTQRVGRVAEASFEHFLKLAVEVLHTPRLIQTDTWAQRITMVNLRPAIEMLNARRPLILLTGHIGNWEVLGLMLTTIGFELDAIARPIDNPLINDWLLGIRQARGMRVITKWDASERMIQVLDRGGALAFIADQNAGDKGMFVPFFGRLASTYKSIGLLAISQDVPIVCGYAHRVGPGFHYELGVEDYIYPEAWADQPDPLYYVTARYNRAMELMIRRRPEQYFWMHRRWKSRPRYERQGRPMARSLRRNLEHLPWMTGAELDALLTAVEPAEPAA